MEPVRIVCSCFDGKTNFVTGPKINLPKKRGIVDELFLNSTICFTLVIHPSILIFENGKNNAAMLLRKINSGICHEVSLKRGIPHLKAYELTSLKREIL